MRDLMSKIKAKFYSGCFFILRDKGCKHHADCADGRIHGKPLVGDFDLMTQECWLRIPSRLFVIYGQVKDAVIIAFPGDGLHAGSCSSVASGLAMLVRFGLCICQKALNNACELCITALYGIVLH